MADDAESEKAAVAGDGPPPTLSKSARKKQQKQERLAAEKERRRADVERRRREWEEALAAAPSEEAHVEMVAARRKVRRERAGQRAEECGAHAERLRRAAEGARQKVVLDLEFGDLMRPNEIHSLTQQEIAAVLSSASSAAAVDHLTSLVSRLHDLKRKEVIDYIVRGGKLNPGLSEGSEITEDDSLRACLVGVLNGFKHVHCYLMISWTIHI